MTWQLVGPPRLVWPLFARHAYGARFGEGGDLRCADRCLVCQNTPNVLGCLSGSETRIVEHLPFCHVGVPRRDDRNPALEVRALDLYSLLHRLSG